MDILRIPVARLILFLVFLIPSAQAATDSDVIERGVALRNSGNVQQAIEYFRGLDARNSENPAVIGELGASLLQARRYAEAEPALRAAYDKSVGRNRARYAVELGNLFAARHRVKEALEFFKQARTLADGDPLLAIVARINETRLVERKQRPALLGALSHDISDIVAPRVRARLQLSVGTLASEVGSLKTAYENLDEARRLAHGAGETRMEVEALDGLAQLYEGQGRKSEALSLTRRGVARAHTNEGTFTDVLIRLEWRQGRLLAAQGASEEARAAYLRAVEYVESIRGDIPIEYESGRSSFRDTLEPIYLGLVDLLLKKADGANEIERPALLRRARDIAELSKQSELQDYLGERCSVDAVHSGAPSGVESGTAIVYPIVLNDRIEVIFESSAGIARHKTAMGAPALREMVISLTESMRNGEPEYREGAEKLYTILVRPFKRTLSEQSVHTLLVVPDGVLRLLPWAALYDGKEFLIEKYAVVTNSGLSMTNQTVVRASGFTSLIAGVAEPGPVVDRLGLLLDSAGEPDALPTSIDQIARGQKTHKRFPATRAIDMEASERSVRLKERLALPGVRREVETLSTILPGTLLLDANFTTTRLRSEFDKGQYRIAHIATHGFFGGSAETSFILAYDNLISMDGLQQMLLSKGVRNNPVDLLTLSACETAEGDDRSPLGFAGAAIKAKARSVLGTLWPVSDEAAHRVMQRFYSGLVRDGLSKAEALRRAQLALVSQQEMAHPFYWAPFVIVGNWR